MADDDMAGANSEFADYFPNDLSARRSQQTYTVLSRADIRQRQEEDITRISSVLFISRADAAVLLCHYNWSVIIVHEEWFADEERVRMNLGLLQNPVVEFLDVKELACGICFKTFPRDAISTAACGHPFCSSCWAGYISTAVNDGPGCLMLRCPDSTCGASVGEDMINVLATEDDRGKYAHYFLRSYTVDSREVKWCPAAGCDYAVEVELDLGNGSYDVTCRCSHSFCWKCTEEAHCPIDCETVANWTSENATVFKDMDWFVADSKKCPKCKSLVKKNQGSMHTTCTPTCEFEFCWICLGHWTDHDACNSYKTAPQEYEEPDKLSAKFSLKRYAHYYERWAANESSRQKAMADLQEIQCEPTSPLMFMVEAWAQIVEYRRVLKLAYVYGYFLPEHEHPKRPLFEYLQGNAEANLEQLHLCVEKVHEELQVYSTAKKPPSKPTEFHKEVYYDLARKTRIYFERLVEAMENDPSDAGSRRGTYNWTAYMRDLGFGTSLNARNETLDFSYMKFSEPRWEIDNFWPCDLCTYANPFSASSCEMCVNPREDA